MGLLGRHEEVAAVTVNARQCFCGALSRPRPGLSYECGRCGGHRGGVLARDPEHGPGRSEVGGRDQGAIGIDRVEWVRCPQRDHELLANAALRAYRHLDRAEPAQAIVELGTALADLGLLDGGEELRARARGLGGALFSLAEAERGAGR